MKKKYIVQVFDRSTNEWSNSSITGWEGALANAYYEAHKFGELDKVEFEDAMLNGQNWCVSNRVIGITDVTPSEPEIEYKDVVVIISGVDMDNGDIKAMQVPFDNYDFFKGYMKRVVEILGGKYDVYTLDEFDMLYNGSSKDMIKKECEYLIHTKIAK